ncbi:hypothetical protein P152DRAFT_459177 [Eremomyces bilateralis CBS 781.70]|uniref:Uncharacterized protein n=1 Tax=Eremomyces bilateralis CBS 781.70 TaxID=1392243 RepID=A0A6G1G101_9PEZI|nr:uncharacterized protein P152DRAFT_459177 [Eremomyces bilateralis CBS 781.70]KAF1811713.1 hypothetical protein P152DRAFT_459177 [Eremomyces bilateralis CBS 781.70]
MKDVLEHPLAAEMDDYIEYKRLRKLSRDALHSRAVQQNGYRADEFPRPPRMSPLRTTSIELGNMSLRQKSAGSISTSELEVLPFQHIRPSRTRQQSAAKPHDLGLAALGMSWNPSFEQSKENVPKRTVHLLDETRSYFSGNFEYRGDVRTEREASELSRASRERILRKVMRRSLDGSLMESDSDLFDTPMTLESDIEESADVTASASPLFRMPDWNPRPHHPRMEMQKASVSLSDVVLHRDHGQTQRLARAIFDQVVKAKAGPEGVIRLLKALDVVYPDLESPEYPDMMVPCADEVDAGSIDEILNNLSQFRFLSESQARFERAVRDLKKLRDTQTLDSMRAALHLKQSTDESPRGTKAYAV